jgi:hypothetical protein
MGLVVAVLLLPRSGVDRVPCGQRRVYPVRRPPWAWRRRYSRIATCLYPWARPTGWRRWASNWSAYTYGSVRSWRRSATNSPSPIPSSHFGYEERRLVAVLNAMVTDPAGGEPFGISVPDDW